ncbi:MG2 domain-containing protein, partial [Deinococcus sp.]|uniref:MG2 domain-containing protein n=1 Tax=Deinococcus sp. TaxID=47478 RepID=UPI0026015507
MKRNSRNRRAAPQRWTRLAALSGLLLLGLAPAERSISIYGGSFTGTEAIEVEVNAPLRTSFTLRRVLDPATMFAATRDPHSPQLSPGARTQLVRTLRLGRTDGTLKLGRLPSGVYLLGTGGPGTGGLSTVVLVSKLGLVVKRDQTAAQTFTADRQSGQTRAARVWALGDKEGTQPSGSPAPRLASADGLARFQKAEYGEKATFLANSGDDWAISGSEWNSYAAPLVRGYVYTDRPVYRPGQHVDFKAVLRRAGNLKPLANTSVRVKVTSPNDEEVFRKTLTTNALGSLGAGLDLPAGARLGEYSFSLTPEGASESGQSDINGSFQVEAYQKPEYAVTVTPERTRAVQGEKVSVKISARYLFGGTLSGAHVNYNVTRAPYYAPGFDSESLAPDSGNSSDYGSDLVIQDETRLDKNGDLNLTLPLAKDPGGNPVSYRVEAEVEDESRRTVSARSQVIAFPASLNVESSTDGYVYDVNKPITVSLDTRDLKAVGRAAPVSLELIREDYSYNKTTRKWIYSEATLSRSSAQTGQGGLSSAVLRAPRSGGYRLRATVRDSQGRRSSSDNFVWVIKPGESLSWNYRDMTLKLDRKSYAPGDTATLLIGNPAPGSAVLVTLEGDRLRQSVVLRSQGAAITYSFPVTADMAPNISVTATSLGGGQLYSGEATVKVPRQNGQLAVKVTPQKARYAPGDTGKLSVDVQAAGKGVAAELALGVVDGAIYLVKRDDSTPISQVFDAPRENVVGTSTSLNFYFSQAGNVAQAPKPAQNAPAFAQAKEGRAADAASADTVTPRQDFRDTILWLPNLLTDAQGHAEVEFKFPDNLTTWVATARAQSADATGPARFGQSTASTMTTKDVIARLSLPPFLVRGDVATLSGIVNNTLIVPVAGRANASLSGLNPLGGAALTPAGTALQIAAEGRARSDMRVQAATVGQASVTFTARTASGNDALKLPLPVKARGIQVTQTAVGSAAGAGVKLNIPADTNLSTLNLNLSLTPSLLSAVAPALEYLVGYP